MTEGNVVTFYSYKGGVGRTFALASIGAALAQWGYKVLCVDWDLEAPGLHLYFEAWLQGRHHPGLLELIETFLAGKSCKWQDFVTTVHIPNQSEPLFFMPAGLLDESYIGRMQSLEWANLYQSHNLGQFVEELRNQWKAEFDFVLIDSRTGITDIGGVCTVQLPDLLVLLFTANHQSIDGAYNVINLARRQRNALPFDRAKLLVLPVVTRFEGRVEYEMAQEWLDIIEHKLEPLYADWKYHHLKPADLLNYTRIPYVPYWSFGERIPVLEEDTKDPESAGYALETLAAMLAHKLADTDTLVANRDSLVANSKLGPARKRTVSREDLGSSARSGVSLFLSYSHKDEALARELMQHLNSLQKQGIINIFDDRRIVSGAEWANEISLALENAQIILLLISADFLASDYAYGVETSRALGRYESGEAIVLPVLLRPVDLSGSPFAKLSLLPSDGHPISTWSNRDEAWVNVVQGIRQAVNRIQKVGQSQVLTL